MTKTMDKKIKDEIKKKPNCVNLQPDSPKVWEKAHAN